MPRGSYERMPWMGNYRRDTPKTRLIQDAILAGHKSAAIAREHQVSSASVRMVKLRMRQRGELDDEGAGAPA